MTPSYTPEYDRMAASGAVGLVDAGLTSQMGRLMRQAGRLTRGAFSLVRARFYLRRAAHLGRLAGVRGRPYVFAKGRLEIGNRVRIHSYLARTELNVGPGARLVVGDDTFINNGVVLSCRGEIRIGARCQIAPQVVIMDNDYHGVENRGEVPPASPVIIEDDVWLATRVTVLRGVTIGRGAVAAAGAVVTKDVPPYTLVAGVPARAIRRINR